MSETVNEKKGLVEGLKGLRTRVEGLKVETKIKNVASMNNSNFSTSQRLNNSTSQQFNKLASHPLTNSSTHLLTGRENIYFNGAILGMTKQEIDNKINSMRLWRSQV